MKEKKKSYLLRIPEDTLKNFKIAVVKSNTNMTQVLNEFIENYVKQKEAL